MAQLGVHDEGRLLVGALDGGEGALHLVALQVRVAHPLDHLAILVARVRRLPELDLRESDHHPLINSCDRQYNHTWKRVLDIFWPFEQILEVSSVSYPVV